VKNRSWGEGQTSVADLQNRIEFRKRGGLLRLFAFVFHFGRFALQWLHAVDGESDDREFIVRSKFSQHFTMLFAFRLRHLVEYDGEFRLRRNRIKGVGATIQRASIIEVRPIFIAWIARFQIAGDVLRHFALKNELLPGANSPAAHLAKS
jgi:hypothetical protein